jgi:hypothetical protein
MNGRKWMPRASFLTLIADIVIEPFSAQKCLLMLSECETICY